MKEVPGPRRAQAGARAGGNACHSTPASTPRQSDRHRTWLYTLSGAAEERFTFPDALTLDEAETCLESLFPGTVIERLRPAE